MNSEAAGPTGRKSRPTCPLCGTMGQLLYERLRDRLFGAPGEWTMKRCPSPGCGLLWLDPMPSEEDFAAAYATYYTHRAAVDVSRQPLRRAYRWFKEGYYGRRFGYPVTAPAAVKGALGLLLYLLPTLRDTLDMRVFFLPAHPAGRLLDVGCGSGATLMVMREMGWQVEGVDLDPVAVETARGLGIETRLGTLESQRYPDASFDAVIVSHVIEHVPDPAELIRESHRILRPGGRLAITTPNAASRGHARFRERWRGLEPPRHVHVFTRGALLGIIAAAGFRLERFGTSPRIAAMIRRESLAPRPQSAVARTTVADHVAMATAYARQIVDPYGGEELLVVAGR